LASRRDVACAKVAHHGEPSSLGDHSWRVQLPGATTRLVPHCLSVRADGAYIGTRDTRLGNDGDRRVSEPTTEVHGEATILLRRAFPHRGKQPITLCRRVLMHMGAQK